MELALVMRKCLPFLIIDANSPIDCKLHKDVPDQIVHSSAMYYLNLIIIHECSKLKMKNSKSFFNTLYQTRTQKKHRTK